MKKNNKIDQDTKNADEKSPAFKTLISKDFDF
jgi:hypothetical protein